MLRKFFSAVFSFILLSSLFVGASVQVFGENERYVVVIDAGHGGHDEGASGTMHESWYNLQVATYCAQKLREDSRFEVVMTRTGDYFLTVAERGLIAAEANADIIISMHFNSIRGSDYSGIEVYSSVLDEFNPQPLCELVAEKLSEASGLPIHDLYRRSDDGGDLYYWNPVYNWDVLGDSTSGIVSDYYGIPTWAAKFGFPGIIIEHGYLSNESDLEVIDSPDMMRTMGEADAEAIVEYFTSHTHEYENSFRVDQRVSCFSAGKKSRHCKHCCHRVDVQSVASAPDPDAHFWIVENLQKADCEHTGFTQYVCRYMQSFIEKGVEGYTAHTKTVAVPAYGHDWQVKYTRELTHTQDGVTIYECTRCHKLRSDVTSAEGHSFEKISHTDPDCTNDGEEILECSVCGKRQTKTIPALGHDYVLVSSTPSVCTQGGEKRYECSRCGFERIDRSVTPGHDMRLKERVEPGCEEPGHEEFVCSVCGYSERKTLDPVGHVFGDPSIIEPDCVTPGIEFIRCSNCGDTRTLKEFPALGHEYTVSDTYDADRDEIVYSFLCVRCGDSFVQTFPASHAAFPAALVPEPETTRTRLTPVFYIASLAAVAALIAASLVTVLKKVPSGEPADDPAEP
ncbi:MAG: N-acetylmuramoyl-L-alanine amidase [Clostridia bacterium]|nr:N-acetylmuramoyl-L-alanine amidase [Clostridia bacterium]